jgi:FixJ family two-component response regulator
MSESQSGRLLVVDDEIETLKPIRDILSEWGYEVEGYTSCREALEALKKQDFDLLLTDLVMPEMDGIELIKAATKINPLLVCIIITGKGTIQTAVEAMKVGAFDFLVKPLDFKMLRPILSRAVEVQRLRQSEARYRSVVEDQTELVSRFLPDKTLTFVNEAICKYFSKKSEELIGQSFLSFVPGEEREKVESLLASLSLENPVATLEHRVICLMAKFAGISGPTGRYLTDKDK